MFLGAMFLGAVLTVVDGDATTTSRGSAPSAEVLQTYEIEKTKAGRDADAHVRLALWCEANGLRAERDKHLALAVLNNPDHAMARGLLGMVKYNGRWSRPDDVTRKVEADAARSAAIATYLDRRARTPQTADEQWKLAVWCEENGLKDESIAHLHAVLRADPNREAAWKRLGYKKVRHQWVNEAELAAAKEAAALQKQANHQWKPKLEGYRKGLESAEAERRAKAEEALAEIRDPRAVPSVWSVFVSGQGPESHRIAVRLLGQIDSASASRALAFLAVSSPSVEGRRAATETLKRRDLREFADLLIALIRDPIEYEVTPVGGQGTTGTLSIKGKEKNVRRLYTPPPVPMLNPALFDQIGFDDNGQLVARRHFVNTTSYFPIGSVAAAALLQRAPILSTPTGSTTTDGAQPPTTTRAPVSIDRQPVVIADAYRYIQYPLGQMLAQAQMANAAARQQLNLDVAEIESYNTRVRATNDRVLPVLKEVAGTDLGPDVEAWNRWFVDQIGMSTQAQISQETPTVIENVPIAFQPQAPNPVVVTQAVLLGRRHSCFGAGTPVRTLQGLQPIESIKVGDVVLTQDVKTGALLYQAVVQVYQNPPNTTLRLTIGDDAIVATPIHRFWKAGHGWVMARDIKPGDEIRTVGGRATVSAVDSDQSQPVFNLRVANHADFFVGNVSVLVHDNSLPDTRLDPFDAATE